MIMNLIYNLKKYAGSSAVQIYCISYFTEIAEILNVCGTIICYNC